MYSKMRAEIVPLKFGNGLIISSHKLSCMWLLFHVGLLLMWVVWPQQTLISTNPCNFSWEILHWVLWAGWFPRLPWCIAACAYWVLLQAIIFGIEVKLLMHIKKLCGEYQGHKNQSEYDSTWYIYQHGKQMISHVIHILPATNAQHKIINSIGGTTFLQYGSQLSGLCFENDSWCKNSG